MKKITLAVGLLALMTSAATAQQTGQSQPTNRAVSGSSATIPSGGMTSTNSGAMTSFGMRDSTTGLNAGSGPERGSPEGSPAAPNATTGPNGQPSNETPPK